MNKKYNRKCFIRSTGKNELKIFHLIDFSNFEMLEMFFSNQEDAIIYAKKNLIEIVHYQESNDETKKLDSLLS